MNSGHFLYACFVSWLNNFESSNGGEKNANTEILNVGKFNACICALIALGFFHLSLFLYLFYIIFQATRSSAFYLL